MDAPQILLAGAVSSWFVAHWLEVFAAAAGILYVWLEIRIKPLMWLVGFLSSLVYVVVYWRSAVYGYAALYVYYTIASIYGWYCWRYAKTPGSSNIPLQINHLRMPMSVILIAVNVVLYIGIAEILTSFSSSPLPHLEAGCTAFSIVATWMVARKILENWFVWLIVDVASVVLFLQMEMYPTVALHAVYSVMCIVGWRNWKKSLP